MFTSASQLGKSFVIVALTANVGIYGLLKGRVATVEGNGPRVGCINSYQVLKLLSIVPVARFVTGFTAGLESRKKSMLGVKP